MPKYVLIDGELVSLPWAVAIKEMRADGVFGNVNEGHRTLARQLFFWNCFRCCCCNNCNRAAPPTPWAPHIRSGRIDHAVDFGNPDAVVAWLAKHGLQPTRPVFGENWHVEVSAAALRKFQKAHDGDKFDTLPKHVEIAARALISARNTANQRKKDRDKFDAKGRPSQKRAWLRADEKLQKAVRKRDRRRKIVKGMLKRARSAKTKRILRQLLDVS